MSKFSLCLTQGCAGGGVLGAIPVLLHFGTWIRLRRNSTNMQECLLRLHLSVGFLHLRDTSVYIRQSQTIKTPKDFILPS